MKHFLTNLRLAVRTGAEHLTDDPLLLVMQISRRLPVKVVRSITAMVRQGFSRDSSSIMVLMAGLMGGDQEDVVRRLEGALSRGCLTAEQNRAMADVALIAERPELAATFLENAVGARRLRAAQARRLWYVGAVTQALDALEDSDDPAERQQRERLTAELQILRDWRPNLPPVQYEAKSARVLHVLTNSLPHTNSGYAQRSHSILLAQQEAGWEAMAVTRVGYPVQVGKLNALRCDVVDGISYRRLLPSRLASTMDGRLQQQAEALLAVAKEFRPTVLHTTTHFTNGLVVRAVAEALGIPWVYEVRGQLADTWASTRGPAATESEKYRLFRGREVDVMRSADLVVTLGQNMKSNIIAAGISKDKVVLAPNAVGGDFLKAPSTAATARRQLNLPLDGLYIGTVSSLVGYEGLDDLVRAFAVLAPAFPHLRLLIVGSGVSKPALEEQVRALGLMDRAIFTGRVPRNLTPLYHQALDVFVVPRKDLQVTRSVTPLKPVEALASGRPVVASDLPALRELVCDGRTGLFARAGDAADLASKLESLLVSARTRADFGTRGRLEVLRERTWAANAAKYVEEYSRLCPGRPT